MKKTDSVCTEKLCEIGLYERMSDLIHQDGMTVRNAANLISKENNRKFTEKQIQNKYDYIAKQVKKSLTEIQSNKSDDSSGLGQKKEIKTESDDIVSQEEEGEKTGSVFDNVEPVQEDVPVVIGVDIGQGQDENVVTEVTVTNGSVGINLKTSDRVAIDKKVKKYLNRMKAGIADAVRGQKDLMIVVGKAGAEEDQGQMVRDMPEWGQLCRKVEDLGKKIKELDEI